MHALAVLSSLPRLRAQPGRWSRASLIVGTCLLVGTLVVSGCAKLEMPAHLKPLSRDTIMLLGAKKMNTEAPIFVRIFKAESELEVWKQRDDGRFHHFKTYPICTWSGELGPKVKQGDKQAPEGFYRVNRHQMNPNSQFHLAFNLGYPNPFDKIHNRTGDFLMVHGDCTSAGCYAMTDPLIEEIYALAREAFIGGQSNFEVHAFPFRMTDENLARHAESPHAEFWATLKQGYDHFERTRMPPEITVCERRYVVNAKPRNGDRVDPGRRCPQLETPDVSEYVASQPEDSERVVVPGVKQRRAMLALGSGPIGHGLTKPLQWSPRPDTSAAVDAPKTLKPAELFRQMLK